MQYYNCHTIRAYLQLLFSQNQQKSLTRHGKSVTPKCGLDVSTKPHHVFSNATSYKSTFWQKHTIIFIQQIR